MLSEIEEVRAQIGKMVENQPYIIVEGKKDIRALNKLGLKNVVEIKGPLYSFIEKVATETDSVVLLTDLDPEGRKLFGAINSGLSHLGVKVDSRFRELLFRRTPLRVIEGLDTYLEH